MNAIEEGINKAAETIEKYGFTVPCAERLAEDIKETANAKAAEELEGVMGRSFVIAGVRHMDTEYVIGRIKELRGKEND